MIYEFENFKKISILVKIIEKSRCYSKLTRNSILVKINENS